MTALYSRRRAASVVVILAGLALIAVWVLSAPVAKLVDWSAASHAALRKPTGFPQLISFEPMPEPLATPDGEMCQWMPASAQTTLMAGLQEKRLPARAATGSAGDARTAIDADRAPVRVIRDSYSTYSAVGVDLNSNEVFLQDENLFGIKVFNRLDNTPPSASLTEPKRVLGGLKTKMEFNCALYIDPHNGDVYSVNNDSVDEMVIFSHEAEGNVAPKRELHTPHGTYGIAVDEQQQELFLTVQHDNSVVVYRKEAKQEEKPIRTLEGDRTHLGDPHGIAVDAKNDVFFVSNHGNASKRGVPGSGKFGPPSVTAYPRKASGDTAPLRIIEGPKTQLDWPAAMDVDPEHGELYVANDAGDSVLVFRETDNGDAAPVRVIKGAKSGVKNPTGIFFDKKNRELWVSNMGNHSVSVYPRTADGDTAPLRTIRSSPADKLALVIGNPGSVGYDSKREEILVPN
jgi:DNA-binding beta-propeller fold protein YncE